MTDVSWEMILLFSVTQFYHVKAMQGARYSQEMLDVQLYFLDRPDPDDLKMNCNLLDVRSKLIVEQHTH